MVPYSQLHIFTQFNQRGTSAKMSSKKRSGKEQAAHSGGISHASSLNKRQKMTKPSVVGEEEDALTSILPLRLAVLGGYLPLKDTGRFLLRVGKDTTASIFDDRVSVAAAVGETVEAKDAVPNDGSEATDAKANTVSLRRGMARNEAWKFLCEQKWRNPSTLEHLVCVLGPSAGEGDVTTVWERLFRKFLPSPPKPAVRASVEDYSFVFTLKKCDMSERDFAIPLTTFVLKGDEAVKFLRTGKSGWLELDSPVLLDNFDRDGANVFNNMMESQSQHMISTLHALRKSDGKSCELNYQFDIDWITEEEEGHEKGEGQKFQFDDGNAINVSDLETIIRRPTMADGRGVSIERQLRITCTASEEEEEDESEEESEEGAGSTEFMFHISHIHFTTMLLDVDGLDAEGGDFGYEFNDPSNELATGVTVADFISRLHVEWK